MNTDLLNTDQLDWKLDLEICDVVGDKYVPVDNIRVSMDYLVRSFLLNENHLSLEQVNEMRLLEVDLDGVDETFSVVSSRGNKR